MNTWYCGNYTNKFSQSQKAPLAFSDRILVWIHIHTNFNSTLLCHGEIEFFSSRKHLYCHRVKCSRKSLRQSLIHLQLYERWKHTWTPAVEDQACCSLYCLMLPHSWKEPKDSHQIIPARASYLPIYWWETQMKIILFPSWAAYSQVIHQ